MNARLKLLLWLMTSATLVVGGISAALAQEHGQDGQEDGNQDGQEDGNQEAHGEAQVQRRANLTGPEQVAEADRILTRGTQIARRVASMLDEARREHDVMRITCLDDKLTQINANLRSATERATAVRDATQMQDRDRGDHEFTVMTVLGQKFRTLEQEANSCIGQDIFETGTTHVETRTDPGTPTEDPDIVPVTTTTDGTFIPPPCSGTC